jgi:hypothetical protein
VKWRVRWLLRGASRLGELTPLAGLVDDIPTAFEKLRDVGLAVAEAFAGSRYAR